MNHRFNRNGPGTRTTIIIPNYNALSFLGPCLESLKQQTVHKAPKGHVTKAKPPMDSGRRGSREKDMRACPLGSLHAKIKKNVIYVIGK